MCVQTVQADLEMGIMLLAVLLSSTFIYNVMRVIDSNTIAGLQYPCRCIDTLLNVLHTANQFFVSLQTWCNVVSSSAVCLCIFSSLARGFHSGDFKTITYSRFMLLGRTQPFIHLRSNS